MSAREPDGQWLAGSTREVIVAQLAEWGSGEGRVNALEVGGYAPSFSELAIRRCPRRF